MHCRLNPQNEAAKRGLERLEKQMKVSLIFLLTIFACTFFLAGDYGGVSLKFMQGLIDI